MTSSSPITTHFSTNKIHKFVLFLASVIFIFSLFLETKLINNSIVQKGAFTFIIIGLIWWLAYEIGTNSLDIYASKDKHSERQIKEVILFWIVMWYIALIV